MKTRSFFLLSASFSIGLLTGCDSGPSECTDPAVAGCMVVSSSQRIQSPDVPQADMDALIQGNTEFAMNLHQKLRAEPGNLFYSPYSITAALAILWAGSAGQTETDIAKAMSFNLPQAGFHPAMNQLDQWLHSRGQGAHGADGGPFRLYTPNAVWGQIGETYEAPFLDTLAKNYGAGMHVVDYSDPADATDIINGWVSKWTMGKIPSLFGDQIDKDTRLVVTNAIYFNAAWAEPFDPAMTRPGTFHRLDGSEVEATMMYGTPDGTYYDGEDFDAVAIPYEKEEISMLFVVPDEGKFEGVESSLDAAKLREVTESMQESMIELTMPKVTAESKFSLNDVLTDLGMGVAFSGDADFSGIQAKGGLYLSDVVHQAYVDISERGTEAAAATGAGVGLVSLPASFPLTIDRPYLMFLRDDQTGAILFAGRIEDPS